MAPSTPSCRPTCTGRGERPRHRMNARSARARKTNGVRTVRMALALGLALLTVAAAGAGLRAAVQVANELTTKNARTEESNLADVLADAIRDVDHSDAAFIQAS